MADMTVNESAKALDRDRQFNEMRHLIDDDAYTQIMKLHSMLCMTYGEAGESFRGLHDDLQETYMWTCCDHAAELKQALHAGCLIGSIVPAAAVSQGA